MQLCICVLFVYVCAVCGVCACFSQPAREYTSTISLSDSLGEVTWFQHKSGKSRLLVLTGAHKHPNKRECLTDSLKYIASVTL